jgi:hypothetical protein
MVDNYGTPLLHWYVDALVLRVGVLMFNSGVFYVDLLMVVTMLTR